MANKHRTVYAIGGRYEFEGTDFGVSVFRVDNEYYASWCCESCLTRGETDLVTDHPLAIEAAQAAANAHYFRSHAAGSRIA